MICYHCMRDVPIEKACLRIYNTISAQHLNLMIQNKEELPLPDSVVCLDCKHCPLPGTEGGTFH